MPALEELIAAHPWRTLVAVFLIGAGIAADRRLRDTLVRTGLELGRFSYPRG